MIELKSEKQKTKNELNRDTMFLKIKKKIFSEKNMIQKYDPNTSLQYSKNSKLTHSPKNWTLTFS